MNGGWRTNILVAKNAFSSYLILRISVRGMEQCARGARSV